MARSFYLGVGFMLVYHHFMKTYLLLLLGLLGMLFQADAQSSDIKFLRGADKIEIPFTLENNFIIVELLLNDIFPLRFILDTGAEHSIITRREVTDFLMVNYQRRFTIYGSDLRTERYAYLAQGIRMQIGNLYINNRNILVLEDDYFRFDQFAGIEVHGILGGDFMRRFIVKIDYRRQLITLFDPAQKKPSLNKFQEIPVEFKRSKPYMSADLQLSNDTTVQVKLLVDTGAALWLLLHADTHPNLALPPNFIPANIGVGLGGNLEGYIGRVKKMAVADFAFSSLVTNFQEVEKGIDSTFFNERNGIIGNRLLGRFDIVIDYLQEKMYFRPNKLYKKKFEYDRSGLSVVASGDNLQVFTVFSIIRNSPAHSAGLLPGDVITKINGMPAAVLTLEELTRRLQKRPGKKIRLTVRRNDERMRFSFLLRDLI